MSQVKDDLKCCFRVQCNSEISTCLLSLLATLQETNGNSLIFSSSSKRRNIVFHLLMNFPSCLTFGKFLLQISFVLLNALAADSINNCKDE